MPDNPNPENVSEAPPVACCGGGFTGWLRGITYTAAVLAIGSMVAFAIAPDAVMNAASHLPNSVQDSLVSTMAGESDGAESCCSSKTEAVATTASPCCESAASCCESESTAEDLLTKLGVDGAAACCTDKGEAPEIKVALED
ncbi:MAG: hypothetical protein WD045_12490 [Pirellulaceae bacterium]